MTYNITTPSIKKFIILWLLWILIFIIFFVLWVINNNSKISFLYFVIGFIVVFVSGLLIALKFSKRKSQISLNENKLEFDDINIKLSDIQGYYINRQSAVMSQIEFRDKNHDYKITSVNYGEKGKEFELFLSDLVKNTKELNTEFKELSFYDFHKKQYAHFRRSIYIDLGILILLNLVYFYLILFKSVPFNWKLLFINFLFIWIYLFHKKNENKLKKQ